jgi:hypothetical protein
MKNTKPKPSKSKFALREPGTPLQKPDAPLRADHPMAQLIAQATPSPVRSTSPFTHDSPSTDASPIIQEPLALSSDSPSMDASPTTYDSPKIVKTVTEGNYRKGDSRINHDFFDARISGLEPLAQVLYFHLNRYRNSGSNLTIVLSWRRLSERIPVTESTLRRAYKRLNVAGLAFKEREVYGKNEAQGIVFRLTIPASPSNAASPSIHDTHKRSDQKENLKGEVSRCDKCRDMNGFYWRNANDQSKGVVKCSHS